MANRVVFEVQVTDKGSLQIVQKQVDALGKSVERTGASHKQASKEAGTFYDTQNKGIIGTANSTKSFSKLAETIGTGSSGVVGAYATLAANIFAVSAAFNALSRAAQVDQVIAGLEAMGNRMGTTLSVVAKNLKEITGGALSTEQAFRSTAQVASSGLGADAVEKLGRVATDTSFALGRNLTDSMDRLTRGVVKLEPELLDELGLMTKLGEATTKYANANGKSESQLSNFERRQAFLNAILAEGNAKFGDLAESAGNTKALDVLGATFADLTHDILSFINTAALPLAGLLGNKGFLLGGMVLFASTISRQLLPGLSNLSVAAAKASEDLLTTAKATAANITPLDKALRGYTSVQKKMLDGTATVVDYEKGLARLNKEIKRLEDMDANPRTSASKRSANEERLGILEAHRDTLQDVMGLEAKAGAQAKAANAIIAAGNGEVRKSYALLSQATAEYGAQLRAVLIQEQAAAAAAAELAIANRLVATSTVQLSTAFKLQEAAVNGMYAGLTALTAPFRAVRTGIAALAGASSAAEALVVLRTGLFAAATGVRVFGAALLNAIPVIGQIILVVTLLYEGVKYLYDLWEGEDTKKFNSALKEQEEIGSKLSGRIAELNRLKKAGIAISAQEVQSSQIITNSIRENIDAYTKSAEAQEKAFKKKDTVEVGDTAEFKLLKTLQDSDLPGVRKEINLALGKAGMAGALQDANKEIDKEGIKKLSNAINSIGKSSLLAYGDAAVDLRDNFKTAEDAVNSFNRNAIPNTPYDELVTQLDGVTGSIRRLAASAADTDGFGAKIAANLAGLSPALQGFLSVDTQKQLNAYRQVKDEIAAQGGIATSQQKNFVKELENGLTVASAELFKVHERVELGQTLVRQAAAEAELMQARLQKLNSFTALSSQDVKRRREAENAIIALQIRQLKAQKDIIESQLIMLRLTNDYNQALLQQQLLISNINLAMSEGAKASASDIMIKSMETLNRLTSMRDSLVNNPEPGQNNAKIIAGYNQQIAAVTKLITLSGTAAASQERVRNGEAQVQALNTKIAAEATKMTSARVIAAEGAAVDAKTALENTQQQAQATKDAIKNEQILAANREIATNGIVDQAKEFERYVTTLSVTLVQDTAVAIAESTSRIADMNAELAKASEQGASRTVAILQDRIAKERVALETKKEQLNLEAESNLLAKAGLDLRIRYVELQRDALQYQEKLQESSQKSLELDRERVNLEREIARKRAGVSATEDYARTTEINAAKDNYEILKAGASLRIKMIDLEFTLLEAQRARDEAQFRAQREGLELLVKTRPELQAQIDAYSDLIKTLEEAKGTIVSAKTQAKENVGKEVENARLGTISTAMNDRAAETIGGAIAQYLERRRAQRSAGQVTGGTPPIASNDNGVGDYGDLFGILTQKGQNPLLDTFKEMADALGPQGTIIPQIIEGITAITDATSFMFQTFNNEGASFGDKFAAIGAVASAALSTISGLLSTASQQRIANIDAEIAAEQRRDGKSAESLAKIQSMEKKKDEIAKKQFNLNKKLMMAQALIATATAVVQALTLGPIAGPILAAAIGALGAAQIAIIASTNYQSTASSGSSASASTASLSIGKSGENKVDLAKQNTNVGGELGYIRGQAGYGNNSSNYQVVGSAYGGRTPRGYGNTAFLVGEKGPEVLTPDAPMMVSPANDNAAMQRPMSAEINITTLDGTGVAEVLQGQRGNIISMLREAANSSGERFMESVDVNVYTRPNVSRL